MMVSTRGRYSVRFMLDLAEHPDDGFIPMKDVAARQMISVKYLEQILPVLSKNGLVSVSHGKGGGYQLARDPKDYTILEILRLTEGDLAPVACLEGGSQGCERSNECKTLPMWEKFYEMTNDYFGGITLADLLD